MATENQEPQTEESQNREARRGFVASDPQLTTTRNDTPRLYFRLGEEHYRRENDGSFTKLENTYHHVVMFGKPAEHVAAKLRRSDNIVAIGRVHEFRYERDGQAYEGKEFIANAIGHDAARTRYDVDRSPRHNSIGQEGPARDAAPFEAPPRSPATPVRVVGM